MEQKRYGYRKDTFDLGKYGHIIYAKWLHPLEGDKTFTEKQIDNYCKVIKPGSTVIDIGAHTGDTAVIYSVAAGDNGKVIAFEPNQYVFDILIQNASLFKNIIPVNFGITDDQCSEPIKKIFHYSDPDLCNGGYAQLLSAGIGAVGHYFPVEVFCINLEKFIAEHDPETYKNISFIKIDTEGFDARILKSIKNIVNVNRPIIQIERFPALSVCELEELYDSINDVNYDCYDFSCYDIDIISSIPLTKKQFIELDKRIMDIICLPQSQSTL